MKAARKGGFLCPVWVFVWVSMVKPVSSKISFSQKVAKAKQKPLKSYDSSGKCWSCWADSNRRPHPYQKAVDAFMVYPFMPSKTPQSLVLQGIEGSSRVDVF